MGAFGAVYHGMLGEESVVAKRAAPNERARYYWDVEAKINEALARFAGTPADRHFAPFLGTFSVEGELHLVWRPSGQESLDVYLDGERLDELAHKLSVAEADLPAELLRQLLAALAHSHACGIVHRDVKPENLLVDAVSGSLVLIDWGSACEMGSWTWSHTGYEATRTPASVLYCPPEQLIDPSAPYAYDLYSAGLIFLRASVSGLGASEEALLAMRLQLRDLRHDPDAWLLRAAAQAPANADGSGVDCSLPDGWEAAFGPALAEPPSAAWALLRQLVAFEPSQRISAAEALVGRYLNADCSVAVGPEIAAPRPWSLEALSAVGRERRHSAAEECELEQYKSNSLP